MHVALGSLLRSEDLPSNQGQGLIGLDRFRLFLPEIQTELGAEIAPGVLPVQQLEIRMDTPERDQDRVLEVQAGEPVEVGVRAII